MSFSFCQTSFIREAHAGLVMEVTRAEHPGIKSKMHPEHVRPRCPVQEGRHRHRAGRGQEAEPTHGTTSCQKAIEEQEQDDCRP